MRELPTTENMASTLHHNGAGSASTDRQDELDRRFAPFAEKMQRAGMPDIVIRTFRYYYAKLLQGETGYIPSSQAQPVNSLPDIDALGEYSDTGRKVLNQTVIIKLNGGLGTSMGMAGPKSLLEVKQGLTFLDIIVRQVLVLRQRSGARLPLVFMNSFHTRDATLEALKAYPTIESDVPLDFLQHKVPKIWKDSLTPVEWPEDPAKEWCPPGHGDLYPALLTSGMLQKLLDAGYEYAFISNSDNLGATVNVDVLGYVAEKRLPFLMEVARRTAADRKGGHLAWDPNQGLILRELAQCPPEEMEEFQDIHRYWYFNTNNLWLHLPTLAEVLQTRDGILGLPMIRNEKPVDPTRPDTPRVYQLETAMGLAIAIFPNAEAVRVRRSRFLPVKKTNDLLVLWSDAVVLTDDYAMKAVPEERRTLPIVDLDPDYYGLIQNMKERFPEGAPSLRQCNSLKVTGDIYFGKNVVIEGDVEIINGKSEPAQIPDNAHLTGRVEVG
jgi:UTP--glucose-1-phosphate uridylyltransferase